MPNYRATITISYEFPCSGSLLDAKDKATELLNAILGKPTDKHKQYSVHMDLLACKDRVGNNHLKEYKPGYVLGKVREDDVRVPFRVGKQVFEVKMNSQRYWLFKDSRVCAACGLEGTKMMLETLADGTNPHFNLYGVEDDKLVLFTKDHIQPKASGGTDTMDNYRTLCGPCNQAKSCYNISYESVRELRELARNKQGLSRKELNRQINETRLLMLDCLNGK